VLLTLARFRPGLVPPSGESGPPREIVVIGAHGGAGATTLAILLRPAWDMGIVPRPARDRPPLRAGGRPVVLVSRNTAAAAGRATTAVNAITWHGERVAVLAVVSDGLPEPVAAAYRFRVLTHRVGAIVRVPFVASLRVADDPARVDLPRKAGRAVADIRTEALSAASRGFTRTP
jgi:hypothetical protein